MEIISRDKNVATAFLVPLPTIAGVLEADYDCSAGLLNSYTFVAQAGAVDSGAGTTTHAGDPTKPADIAVGDLLVCVCYFSGNPGAITFTGWTESKAATASNAQYFAQFYKTATAADVAGSTWSLDTVNSVYMTTNVGAWRAAAPLVAMMLDVCAGAADTATPYATPGTAAASHANELHIVAYGGWNATEASNPSFSTPGGYTARTAYNPDMNADGYTLQFFDKLVTGVGSVAAVSTNVTNESDGFYIESLFGGYCGRMHHEGWNEGDTPAAPVVMTTGSIAPVGEYWLVSVPAAQMNYDNILLEIQVDDSITQTLLINTVQKEAIDTLTTNLATVDTVVDAIAALQDAWVKGLLTFDANTPGAGQTTMKLYNVADALIATWVITDATGNRAEAT